MAPQLPTHAQIVIIGGGIIGCSLAYHLTKLGRKDVLLLERKKLTSGTTWHAAGLVRAMLYTANLTKLAKYTVDLYKTLERETGQATGYKQNGSLSIATNEERWDELRRGASMARAFGVAGRAGDAQARAGAVAADEHRRPHRRHPLPGGRLHQPRRHHHGLRQGARAGGARLVEDCKVTGVLTENGRALGVHDRSRRRQRRDRRELRGPVGPRGRQDGRRRRAAPCLRAFLHRHRVHERARRPCRCMRDMDACAYYKEDAGKLLVGAFEPKAKPWARERHPRGFLLHRAAGGFRPFRAGPAGRHPPRARARRDRHPQVLQRPRELHDRPALSARAVARAGELLTSRPASTPSASSPPAASAMALAHWIAEGHPPFDLWDVDSRRSMPHQNSKSFLIDRVSEALGLLYAMHWPYRQFETARGVRKTPPMSASKAHNACFGEVAGWERANWFAPEGVEPKYQYSFKRQNWFDYCARGMPRHPHRRLASSTNRPSPNSPCAARCGERVLQRICANDVASALRPRGLHPVAEQARRHRGRPHGHAPRRRRLHGRNRRARPPAATCCG